MGISIEVRTRNYEDDAIHVKKSVVNLASLCGEPLGYNIGEPTSKFGWTFYTIHFDENLFSKINTKFDDMIQKSRGKDDKFITFMTRYFDARGAKVNLKLLTN
ncbi:MAG: hypothetical protein K8823_1011 [Cenarchaeum symbiont of Oopsacas minuta]|nr:hypothetical protein [Cenarchaeum symbiont of Oopsacas minuta]